MLRGHGERRRTGITARQQRKRRTNKVHPAEWGTTRGTSKYLRVLRSLAALRFINASRIPREQKMMVREIRLTNPGLPKHLVCFKPANRAMGRWVDRYWSAEGQVR